MDTNALSRSEIVEWFVDLGYASAEALAFNDAEEFNFLEYWRDQLREEFRNN